METNIITLFSESYLYLFLFVVPFSSQLWIPLWTMFFILFAGALIGNITEVFGIISDFGLVLFLLLVLCIIWINLFKKKEKVI